MTPLDDHAHLTFDRLALLAARDEIGTAAAAHCTRLDLAIYGASPGEFRSRNVMTDEAPLRRACQPPVEPLR